MGGLRKSVALHRYHSPGWGVPRHPPPALPSVREWEGRLPDDLARGVQPRGPRVSGPDERRGHLATALGASSRAALGFLGRTSGVDISRPRRLASCLLSGNVGLDADDNRAGKESACESGD